MTESKSECNVSSFFLIAMGDNPVELLAYIEENELDVNCLWNEDGLTLLMFACQLGQRVTAQKLIELGAAVNQRSNQRNGSTALMEAAYEGHSELVRMLLAAWADVNITDQSGNNALMWASMAAQYDTIITLLNYGANHTQQNSEGCTALDLVYMCPGINSLSIDALTEAYYAAEDGFDNGEGTLINLSRQDYYCGENW